MREFKHEKYAKNTYFLHLNNKNLGENILFTIVMKPTKHTWINLTTMAQNLYEMSTKSYWRSK